MNDKESMETYDRLQNDIKNLEVEQYKHNVAANRLKQVLNVFSPEILKLIQEIGPAETREIELRKVKDIKKQIEEKQAQLRAIEISWDEGDGQ